MNLRNVLRILIIGLFISSLTAGYVSGAPGSYDYTYTIEIDNEQEVCYQIGPFNEFGPFIHNPTGGVVYENVAVYDSENNFVGYGDVVRYSGKFFEYNAGITWHEDEVPSTNNTNIDDLTNNATNNSTYQNTTTDDQVNNGDDNSNQFNDTSDEEEEHLPRQNNTINQGNSINIPMETTGNSVVLLIIMLAVITVVAYLKRN